MPALTACLSGAVFGAGLVVSGMTEPANVQGFLDIAGDFRPALAFVMAAALVVYGIAIRAFPAPSGATDVRRLAARIDGQLLVGAAVFGVGWALAGFCPGPSIVALGAGRIGAAVFVIGSAAGLFLADAVRNALARAGESETVAIEPGEVAETT